MNHPMSEIFCVLVPLVDTRLLLPRTCVAEVTSYSDTQPIPGSPPWLLGHVVWNDRRIPLLSFESACGRSAPERSARTRIAVLPAIANKLKAGYFGIVVQGFPQLVNVAPGSLKPSDDDESSDVPVLCRPRMVNERPAIPDLERLEDMLAEYCAVQF